MREPIQIGLAMEQAMGHVTHHRALLAAASDDPCVRAISIPVPYHAPDIWERIPGVRSNLSLLLSLRTRHLVGRAERGGGRLDVLFLHTQVMSHFSLALMRRIPTVLSIDATPLNVDPVSPAVPGPFTRRAGGGRTLDRLKFLWTRAALRRAAAITTWNCWARDSVVRDYGIPADRVVVIPPGVDLSRWRPSPARAETREGLPRLLMVGGHFARKGGKVLLDAFRRDLRGRAELHIATTDPSVAPEPGVHVHAGLAIDSPELRRLYQEADIFVLPTLNDCTPLAIIEAMASGLPVVASDVGAIREQVEDGVTGLLVRPGDAGQLAAAVLSMLEDPARRRAMGAAGRARAQRHFSADDNYRRLLALLRDCAGQRSASGRSEQSKGDPSTTRSSAASASQPEATPCQTGC